MEGTFVWKCSLTTTRPWRSVSIPSSSRPSPDVKGRRPVATSTTSKSSLVSSPPLEGATVNVTPVSDTSLATTPVESLNFMPCFFRMRRKFLPISPSMPGTIPARREHPSPLIWLQSRTVKVLDYGHFRAEPAPNAAHLKADHTASDYGKLLGNLC